MVWRISDRLKCLFLKIAVSIVKGGILGVYNKLFSSLEKISHDSLLLATANEGDVLSMGNRICLVNVLGYHTIRERMGRVTREEH